MPSGNPYGFTGRRLDIPGNDSYSYGIIHYRVKYYNPVTRRFISKEPIGYIDSMNLYEYVKNRVLIDSDTSGLLIQGTAVNMDPDFLIVRCEETTDGFLDRQRS